MRLPPALSPQWTPELLLPITLVPRPGEAVLGPSSEWVLLAAPRPSPLTPKLPCGLPQQGSGPACSRRLHPGVALTDSPAHHPGLLASAALSGPPPFLVTPHPALPGLLFVLCLCLCLASAACSPSELTPAPHWTHWGGSFPGDFFQRLALCSAPCWPLAMITDSSPESCQVERLCPLGRRQAGRARGR